MLFCDIIVKRGVFMDIKLDTTLERDMDLLIMEEFISDPAFAHIFLNAVGIAESYIKEAIPCE